MPTADTQAAAFKLEARSDMLRYPDNDYGKIVFDPEARGKTDRFVMRLRKPE
jgi:predicted methyltransferase